MKTKLSIMGMIAALIYSCQDKTGVNSNEDKINQDLVQAADIERQTLREWFSFNREADSVIASADSIIKREIENHDRRGRTKNNIVITQYHLERLKKKVKYIKDYEVSTEHFDENVSYTLDSLKVDYLQEKLKLEAALCEFNVYELP